MAQDMAGRDRSRVLVVGVLVSALCAVAPVAHAAPSNAPLPSPSGFLPEGPWPPSKVLAPGYLKVPVPRVAAAATATAVSPCPATGNGSLTDAPGAGKTVALTFDDGPGSTTEPLMRILEDAGVTATFFNIGVNQAARPATVRALAAQGFLLGNHTWSHPDMASLSLADQAAQLDNATAEQVSLVGAPPCVYRPPYSSFDQNSLDAAQARNMAVWLFNVDTLDFQSQGSTDSYWVDRMITLNQAGGSFPHPNVDMHDPPAGLPATVSALPAIISFYRSRGYSFVDLAGKIGDQPLVGDWDGNGTATPGIVRGDTWYLRNSDTAGPADVAFQYGFPSDRHVVGDWDGNGTVTPGVVRGNTWYLRNSNTAGPPDVTFTFGDSSDKPVVGDWNGDHTTTPGVVRNGTWYLRNSNTGGYSDLAFQYGNPSDRAVVGDWDGNGTVTAGVMRGNKWYLRDANSSGYSTASFGYGNATDRPVVGDWDGNGTQTPGVVRGGTWYLHNSVTTGYSDTTAAFSIAP